MNRNNRKRTIALVLLFATAAAILVGIAVSAHSTGISSASPRHMMATNGLTSGSRSVTQPVATFHSLMTGGACHRCVVAHPYEAQLIGA